jgi:hypothetical protein
LGEISKTAQAGAGGRMHPDHNDAVSMAGSPAGHDV